MVGPNATLSESRLRSMVNFTASASSGVPSWNLTPLRTFTSSVEGSTTVAAVARAGTSSPFGCLCSSES